MSYLENRSQFVQYKNCDSEVLRVCCGVPQGSILEPKLFIMYINDIFNASKLSKFILFADDTNMFYCNTDNNANKCREGQAHCVVFSEYIIIKHNKNK